MIRSFRLTDAPSRGPILQAVKTAGFTVERIEEDLEHPDKWGLVLKPSRQVADLFRLDREVLLWCTNYPRFQARDIEDIRRVIDRLGVRLTRSFVILVSKYDPATRNALEAESALDTTIAHFSMADLKQPRRESGEPTLVRLLLDRLYTRDLYDLPVATTRGADFFGRRRVVDAITDELITGEAQVGIFGLRKVGKTSLANRVIDTVNQSGRCIVARLDLQWTTSIDPQPEYTLWALGEAIHASGRIARNVKGLKMFGRYSMASEARGEVAIWETFAHDLSLVLKSTNRRLVIALDEIERLVEIGETGGYVRLGRLLRGFDQQHPGRLRLLISGTSPECAEAAILFGVDNPFYRYLSVRYLGPLDGPDPENLLKQLGQPIGLEWTEDAVEYAVNQTGGHPALLRTLGSHVHRNMSPRSGPVAVDQPTAAAAAESILTSDTAVLAQVTASLSDQYEDEFVMLEMLACGKVFNFRQLASTYSDELSHLIGYGLLPDGANSERLSMGMLQSYIQQLSEGGGTTPGDGRSLQVDAYVDKRRIVAQLKSGGFADVYMAIDPDGQRTAIKAFRSARLSALEREVEHLQALEHPSIVRFIEATQTPEGTPCLVMEFLEGRTLAEMCNQTSAPSRSALLAMAEQLLDACAYMHPDPRRASLLAAKNDLTSGEFEEWERHRYGVVHRDIKPENILITKDRAVLIDFNIAVRAADPVKTLSATPGYLPPGFNGVSWTPDVDLFQLGVTLAQAGAGARYDEDNLADLLELVETRHDREVAQFIRLLTLVSPGVSTKSFHARVIRLLGR